MLYRQLHLLQVRAHEVNEHVFVNWFSASFPSPISRSSSGATPVLHILTTRLSIFFTTPYTEKCEVEHLAWATDKTKTDLNLWKCNAGCLCKAIGTASNQPTWTMPTTNGMGPTTSALQPQHTGMGALYDTHQGTVNRYDAVCYALLRPGSEHYDDWVQIFEGGEKPSSPTAASSQKAFLGDNNECLDLCFRLAAYYYGSPEHGSACQLFGWMQPTTPQSPNGLPGKDYVVAGTGETA